MQLDLLGGFLIVEDIFRFKLVFQETSYDKFMLTD